MNFKVVFRPRATADLDDIYDFIARDSPPAAIAFVRRIRDHCTKLAYMPERGPRRDDLAAGIRILPFERRTVIIYRIDDNTVRILRVLYGGRDYPKEWIED
ncbi:type II toxin-antitoxin system RelE/ParE family toxin [Mesorhizobium sp. ASY16-5R]|uniref:type II toxin-antitoxin system RelE/ParE family toxin n=1 Tax=Mesorhizobium sp. ASY16-5R TaxID=3445772 RepID=UPI003F9FCAC9